MGDRSKRPSSSSFNSDSVGNGATLYFSEGITTANKFVAGVETGIKLVLRLPLLHYTDSLERSYSFHHRMYHIQPMEAWILIYLGMVKALIPSSYPWYCICDNDASYMSLLDDRS